MARIYIDTDELHDLAADLRRTAASLGDIGLDLLRSPGAAPPPPVDLLVIHARSGAVAARASWLAGALGTTAGALDAHGWEVAAGDAAGRGAYALAGFIRPFGVHSWSAFRRWGSSFGRQLSASWRDLRNGLRLARGGMAIVDPSSWLAWSVAQGVWGKFNPFKQGLFPGDAFGLDERWKNDDRIRNGIEDRSVDGSWSAPRSLGGWADRINSLRPGEILIVQTSSGPPPSYVVLMRGVQGILNRTHNDMVDYLLSPERYQRFLREALEQAGVPTNAQLSLIGHSQGGAAAIDFARAPGPWANVRDLVTLGAPKSVETAGLPTSINAISLANHWDPVPRLFGATEGDRVHGYSSLAGHDIGGYATQLDQGRSPQLDAARASIEQRILGTGAQEARVFRGWDY